jgi:ketosteroid isomerase-like protein
MDHVGAQRWLDRYLAAWRSNDPDEVADLFAEDVRYRYHPFDDAIEDGREGLLSSWFEELDAPDSWEARYVPWAVDGDRVVATGWTRYFATASQPEKLYHNCFLIEFDHDGRCTDFTEFYIRE